jgi:hypothetical protein
MSNFNLEIDSLKSHLEELKRRHAELNKEIEIRFKNISIDDSVQRMKTMKLWLKDEIHRITEKLNGK